MDPLLVWLLFELPLKFLATFLPLRLREDLIFPGDWDLLFILINVCVFEDDELL